MQYTQRGGKRLTMLASYTYSKSIDLQTQSTSVSNGIPDVFDVSSERGLSDYDARHILNLGWTLTLPLLSNGYTAVRNVLNHWTFSGVYNARTGQPFSVTLNNDTALDSEPNQRAELLPGMNPRLPNNRHRADKAKEWFNTSAFCYPMLGTFSKVPRNFLTGPAYINTNFAVGRIFPMEHYRQGMKMQFRAEALNVFNTPNLGMPAHTYSCSSANTYLKACSLPSTPNSTIGVIQSTYGTNGTTSSNGRKMQFSLTLYY
jgi:hypothetical protein